MVLLVFSSHTTLADGISDASHVRAGGGSEDSVWTMSSYVDSSWPWASSLVFCPHVGLWEMFSRPLETG